MEYHISNNLNKKFAIQHVTCYSIQEQIRHYPNLFTRTPRILLVEDTPVIQRVHVKYLQLLNCDVEVAVNGREALAKCQNEFDLIFMDIGLPDVNGIQVAMTIRKLPAYQETPIIALTAYGEHVIDACVLAGINEVVVKPTPLYGLRDVLTRWLTSLVVRD